MKRLLVILMISFIVIFSPTTSINAFQNEPDGFRGLKWGTPLNKVKNEMSDCEDYVHAVTKVRMIRCTRQGDLKQVGIVKILEINYHFYNEKFVEAELIIKPDDFELLKKEVFDKFGEVKPYGEDKDSYYWHGKQSNVSLSRFKIFTFLSATLALTYRSHYDAMQELLTKQIDERKSKEW